MSKSRNIYRKRGTGTIRKGYLLTVKNGRQVGEHTQIVERVLGRELPPGVVVHHVDGDPLNNAHENLLVCPDQAYHLLIHARTRAYDACGHSDWRKCSFCQTYDSLDGLKTYRGAYYHNKCKVEDNRRRRGACA